MDGRAATVHADTVVPMDGRRACVRPGPWATALAALCLVAATSACTSIAGVAPGRAAADADPSSSPTPTASEVAGAPQTASPSPADAATGADSPSPETPVGSDVPANAEVLDFTARRLAGGTIEGTQLAGRDVALWMWAPWCPQCNREAPHVAEAFQAHGDRVMFVGMAGHDTDDAHRAFVDEHGLGEMLHVVDEDGSLWSQYGVSYQPAWVFIDEDGTVEVVAGGLYDDLGARLQALVDE